MIRQSLQKAPIQEWERTKISRMVVVLLLLLLMMTMRTTMMRIGLLSGGRGEAPVPTMQQAVALQQCLSVAMVMMTTTIIPKLTGKTVYTVWHFCHKIISCLQNMATNT